MTKKNNIIDLRDVLHQIRKQKAIDLQELELLKDELEKIKSEKALRRAEHSSVSVTSNN